MSRNDSVSGKITEEYKSNWDKIFGDKSGCDKEDRKGDNELSDAKPARDGDKNA